MGNSYKVLRHKKQLLVITVVLFLLIVSQFTIQAQSNASMRRPISPSSPMWIVHIDTWNYADPQKIIDLIPKDIRPYVVMNISLSVSHDVATSQYKVAEYGYEIAKSWVRTCAQNQMWAMVQPASGGYCQFSDFDLSVYEEFYRDYPNFIGFNYAEQFWGFDDSTDPLSPKWTDRIAHFSDLLKLNNKYGGYLVVSWCANQWSPSINPIAMLKRNPAFAAASKLYAQNYILCEKYTQVSYNSDVESLCLGAYLSGYSGQYGIRYDNSGWTDATGVNQNFTLATAGAIHLEHIMLTGETVIDGPEIIWTNCFKENNSSTTSDGYTRRSWATFAHFDNVMIDIFRKILDGTVRIPSRKEVIARTKYVITNDISSGDIDAMYSSPQTLFEGLYRMDGDGNLKDNKTFFKKTGRYPTIPTVYQLNDADANSFQYKINKSGYDSRWSNVTNKVTEMNNVFPQDYTGDLYAGRNENAWVIYNPYKTDQTASGSIPFKYNTCDHMNLTYSRYTASVVKEYSNQVTFYLSNFDDEVVTGLKPDIIKIYGSSVEPTWSYVERGNHQASIITKSWSGGIFTLSIQHNGPVDITINCSGTATGRLTAYTPAILIPPAKPVVYTGPLQYEAECFDRKSVSSVITSGYSGSVRNYSGQGYVQFGTNAAAAIRDTVKVLKNGVYKLQTKYSAAVGAVTTIDLYVNGVKVATPTFTQTASVSTWAVNTQSINLNAGTNTIVFKANGTGVNDIYFDNIIITSDNLGTYDFTNDVASLSASTPPAGSMTLQSGTAGVVSYTDANSKTSNCFKAYSVGALNGTGIADLDLFPVKNNYSVTWKEYYGTSGGKKGILLRGNNGNGYCPYAIGMKQGYLFISQNNGDNTVTLMPYKATSSGISPLQTYTSSFSVAAAQPCWYRTTATGNALKFECSKDSVTWEGGTNAAFTDTTYANGTTQLVWGLGSNNFSWQMDNITYLSGGITVSTSFLSSFTYQLGSGPSTSQSFTVSGKSLTDDLAINAPTGFEVSLSSGSGYASALSIARAADLIPTTTVYVRMKSGLAVDTFSNVITLVSGGAPTNTVSVVGIVNKVNNTFENLSTSINSLSGFSYVLGSGTSSSQALTIAGSSLGGNVTVNAPTNYEVSLSSGSGFASSVSVAPSGTAISATIVYVRLKQGLIAGPYSGNIVFSLSSGIASNIVQLSGTVSNPLVTATGASLNDFNYISGYASPEKIIVISGKALSDNIVITAPDNFEVSLSSGSGYAQSLTLAQSNGSVAATNIYVRLKSALGVGGYSGNISITSIGATSTAMAVSGSVYAQAVISASETSLTGLGYSFDLGSSPVKSFIVSGNPLVGNISVAAPTNFEVSLSSGSGYNSSLTLTQSDGMVIPTIIYVRLKTGLTANTYSGDITIASSIATNKTISLNGVVNTDKVYTFSTDVASTIASAPPAANMTIGSGNGATAGVVSYTDAGSLTSNCFKAYGVTGSNNNSGVVDLGLFPSNATDYSVTWKEYIGTSDYKVGVLLRGNSPVGTASSGYTQGLMQGYVFIIYNVNSTPHSEFRIYKSTTAINMLVNNTVNALVPTVGQPVWYRASVSGSTAVSLTFEYSTDGVTWTTAATASDTSTPFASGSSQIVWGLAASTGDFYMDDITYTSPQTPSSISSSASSLSGLSYTQENGPSASQSFTVSGSLLTDNIVVSAPSNFEVSLSASSGYSSSLTLSQSSGIVSSTNIYTRLKSGLVAGSYSGSIFLTSAGATSKAITLTGTISSQPVITVSTNTLSGFVYNYGSATSPAKSFTVSGSALLGDLLITAPADYEVSVNSTSEYSSSISLGGTINQATIYTRLKTGLAANTYNEDITITSTNAASKTVSLNGTVNAPTIIVSSSDISGLSYTLGSGPSTNQLFTLSGSFLADKILVNAPDNFEISLSSASGYTSLIIINPTNGIIATTNIYVRLISGLAANTFSGNISITSTNAIAKTVLLSGSVTSTTGLKNLTGALTTVVSIEYYTLIGQKVLDINAQTGVFIAKKLMSDGTTIMSKVLVKKK
jgi:hypothetical protein